MRIDLLHYSMNLTSLLLYLLIILTRQIKSQVCSKESVEIVIKITEELSQVKNDSMLYTPSLADYEQNCSRSTLACFALEVKVLFFEIQSVAESLSQNLSRILKKMKFKLQDKMKPCPDCEFYQEQSFETFMETLKTVLQLMNDECASKKNKRHLENVMKIKKTLQT